jgi:DNA-binding NarL/FixJ family response regulator
MTRLVFIDETIVILLESDLPPAALVAAIQGGTWLPPVQLAPFLQASTPQLRVVRLQRLVIVSPADEPREPANRPAPDGFPPLTLSPRQRQVLQGLADGLTNRQIGAQLGLHKRTIDMHIAAIKHRFGTTSAMQSVLRGVALGLCKVRSDPKGTPDIGYTWPIERGPSRPHPPRNDYEERTLPDPPDK